MAGRNSPMGNVWRKLKMNRWAMVSLVIILLIFLMAIFAPLLTPYDYAAQNYESVLESPSLQHPFGTDNFGRDVLSRIIYGSRYTVFIGFGCITIAAAIGIALGLVAAYFSKLDNIIMRIWERGSGITMASGSGSCASALAAMITGRTARRVNVHLVYGQLTVEWADDGFVYQEGPATEVYVGQWPEG